MKTDNKNNIIEFLIECLVISKLSSKQQFTKIQNNKFKTKFRNTLHLSKRFKLDKLININNMETEYENFTVHL